MVDINNKDMMAQQQQQQQQPPPPPPPPPLPPQPPILSSSSSLPSLKRKTDYPQFPSHITPAHKQKLLKVVLKVPPNTHNPSPSSLSPSSSPPPPSSLFPSSSSSSPPAFISPLPSFPPHSHLHTHTNPHQHPLHPQPPHHQHHGQVLLQQQQQQQQHRQQALHQQKQQRLGNEHHPNSLEQDHYLNKHSLNTKALKHPSLQTPGPRDLHSHQISQPLHPHNPRGVQQAHHPANPQFIRHLHAQPQIRPPPYLPSPRLLQQKYQSQAESARTPQQQQSYNEQQLRHRVKGGQEGQEDEKRDVNEREEEEEEEGVDNAAPQGRRLKPRHQERSPLLSNLTFQQHHPKLSCSQTSNSYHHRKLSPNPNSGSNGVPDAARPQSLAPSAPLVSPPLSTTSSDVAQKPSKKRKLMAVVDSLQGERPLPVMALGSDSQKVASPSLPTLRPRMMPVASGAEDAVHRPQVELRESKDREGFPVSSMQVGKASRSPGKKLLKAVLDKLQKKDKYGVFSEPVDPKEVPDYYDVIKDPMDFGTMRKRITAGYYTALDPFEKDISTICNNAMKYNRKGSVYHRQARAIKEVSDRIMEYLKSVDLTDVGSEVLAKLRAWGPCGKKSHKKQVTAKAWLDRAGSEHVLEGSVAYSTDGGGRMQTLVSNGSLGRLMERLSGNATIPIDVNADDPSGRRQQFFDETRRTTYRPLGFSIEGTGSSVASISGEPPQFVPTGYQLDFPYARSLARFAADLGPAVWKIAAEKIRKALPPGFPFGPGWVGDREALGGVFVAPLKRPPPSAYAHPKMIKLPTDAQTLTLADSHTVREGSMRGLPMMSTHVNLNHPPCLEAEKKSGNEDCMHGDEEKQVSKANLSTKDLHKSSLVDNAHRDLRSSLPRISTLASCRSMPPHHAASSNAVAPLNGSMPSSTVFPSNMKMPSQHVLYNEHQPGKEIGEMGMPRFNLSFTGGPKNAVLQERLPDSWTSVSQPDRVLFPEQSMGSSKLRDGSEEMGTSHAKNVGGAPSKTGSNVVGAQPSDASTVASNNPNVSAGASPAKPILPILDGATRGLCDAHVQAQQLESRNEGAQMAAQAVAVPFSNQQIGPLQLAELQEARLRSHQQLLARISNPSLGANLPQFLRHPQLASSSQQPSFPVGGVDPMDPNLLKLVTPGVELPQHQAWQYTSSHRTLHQAASLPRPAAPDLNVTIPPLRSNVDHTNGGEIQQPDLALQL